jgi:hypothetical protein
MCSIPGCTDPAKGHGWCSLHVQRWRRHGDPTAGRRPSNQPCEIPGCSAPAKAQGYCNRHYHRWRLTGDPQGSTRPTPEQRLWGKIDKGGPVPSYAPQLGGCWLWTAARVHGYGIIFWNGRNQPVHRIVYELLVNVIPEGLTLDHLCRVRHCCRPEHLEPVTHQENILRGQSPIAHQVRQTHCKRGHPFDEVNTIQRANGQRGCRICKQLTRPPRQGRGASA